MTDTTKLKPQGDKVLVKVATDEEITASGIILTSAKHERKYEGVVIDVGTHEDIKKYGIKVGMYVFYPKGLNTEILVKEDNVDVAYDFVSVYDILAVGTEE